MKDAPCDPCVGLCRVGAAWGPENSLCFYFGLSANRRQWKKLVLSLEIRAFPVKGTPEPVSEPEGGFLDGTVEIYETADRVRFATEV